MCLSAIAALANWPKRIEDIFSNDEHNEWGVYAIKICKNGEWVVLLVDDYLPCGYSGKSPAFARAEGDELWVMILEKALAKCYGAY
mmetsp:Transcript_12457/g.1865  ORF Transcript_12457/g.1865 Transcript_12457/m.1865 type:complete len:86 (+) Transcript_12457:307-564(+)